MEIRLVADPRLLVYETVFTLQAGLAAPPARAVRPTPLNLPSAMQIFIGNFPLAAGGDEAPENLRINGRRQVQTAGFLRAAGAGVFARGDRVNTISFAVTREHASYGAAEGFLFSHAATLPAGGALAVICEDAGGAQVRYTARASAVTADEGTQQRHHHHARLHARLRGHRRRRAGYAAL